MAESALETKRRLHILPMIRKLCVITIPTNHLLLTNSIKGYNSHSITNFSAMQSKKPDSCFIVVEEKEEWSMAAFLGYKIAIPGLEELKSNMEYLAGYIRWRQSTRGPI